jgi:gluconolactonase
MPPDYRVLDSRFESLVDRAAELRQLFSQCEWAEGPVWLPDRESLVWSDIPNDRMLSWSENDGVVDFRSPCGKSNGSTLDREGRIVTCEHTTNRVVRTEHDGTVNVLVERYQGRRLNSPNDVVVKTDGSIWFTDPPYGLLSEREGRIRESELDGNFVFRLDSATGELTIVARDLERPNGIAFSPDESVLYVADSRPARHIRAFGVRDGQLEDSRVFAVIDEGVPDGFRVDTAGNLWSSAADGLHVFAPDGTLLGKIMIPEKVANLEFGARDRSTLFITASTSLYALHVGTKGSQRF